MSTGFDQHDTALRYERWEPGEPPTQPGAGGRPRRQRLGSRLGPEVIVSTGLSGVCFEDAIDLRPGGMLQIVTPTPTIELDFIETPQY